MKKIKLKDMIIESEYNRKVIPKTRTLRVNLIGLALLSIFFLISEFTVRGIFLYLIWTILILLIIKITYDTYKITKVFETWEKNYNKYKKLFR